MKVIRELNPNIKRLVELCILRGILCFDLAGHRSLKYYSSTLVKFNKTA